MSATKPYTIDQRLRATKAVYESADEYSPGGYLCAKGDILIVRHLASTPSFAVHVSHEHIHDKSFGVHDDEVEDVP